MDNVTVVVPMGEGGSEPWLQEAVASIPPGVKHVVARNNGDLAGALNQAIRDADTEFVFRLDADDVMMPDTLDWLKGPSWNADVVYPSMVGTDANLSPTFFAAAEPFCGHRLLRMNYITSAALMRRSKVLEVGGYRDMEALEDWDLWVRLFRAGARFKPCEQAQILYRIHGAGRNERVRADPDYRGHLRKLIVGDPDPVDEFKATFYSQATPGTTYPRCQLPARFLPGQVVPHLQAVQTPDGPVFPDHRGAAVLQFPADRMRAAFALAFRADGIRTLVEVDDNYLINPGRDILKRSGWSMEIGDAEHSRQGHAVIARDADGVICSTPLLAEKYQRVNPNVYVCPNTVDPADWPDPVKPDDGVFRIGWLASKSHTDDIPLITRAFEWASRQPGVEVYVGGIDPRWKFKYGRLPWMHDLDQYRDTFRFFDVGVAPVRETPFNLHRSDLKALEISMGLSCPVLSDLEPYKGWKDRPCLMAKDAKGFLHAVKHLVAHQDEARQLAREAREYVLRERTTAAQIGAWEEAING